MTVRLSERSVLTTFNINPNESLTCRGAAAQEAERRPSKRRYAVLICMWNGTKENGFE